MVGEKAESVEHRCRLEMPPLHVQILVDSGGRKVPFGASEKKKKNKPTVSCPSAHFLVRDKDVEMCTRQEIFPEVTGSFHSFDEWPRQHFQSGCVTY